MMLEKRHGFILLNISYRNLKPASISTVSSKKSSQIAKLGSIVKYNNNMIRKQSRSSWYGTQKESTRPSGQGKKSDNVILLRQVYNCTCYSFETWSNSNKKVTQVFKNEFVDKPKKEHWCCFFTPGHCNGSKNQNFYCALRHRIHPAPTSFDLELCNF